VFWIVSNSMSSPGRLLDLGCWEKRVGVSGKKLEVEKGSKLRVRGVVG
jgi:hypothetical protein